MRNRVARVLTALGMLLVTVALVPGAAEAAPPAGRRATPHLLDEAVARGEISRAAADDHLVDVFVGRGRSGNVPARFQSDVPWDGTMPLLRLRERLAARPASTVKARTEAALAAVTSCSDSTVTLPNETASTHFYISYGSIAGGLTVTNYVNSLEGAWSKEVTSFGWPAPPSLAFPPPAPIGSKYPVRVAPLAGGLYGFVSTSGTGAGFRGDNPNTAWDDQDAYATCMVLTNDYSPFPGTSQQALDATTAHEFNHSIQFGLGAIQGPNVPDDLFFEGGATWMEDEVYDTANDNYNYLWPDFNESLGDYDGSSYETWLFLRGLTERFGTGVPGGGEQVMQDFWEATSKNTANNLSALAFGLGNKGVTLADAYHDFAIGAGFMKPCGGGYVAPDCFEEAASYVAAAGGLPLVDGSIATVGGSFSGGVEDDYSLAWVSLPLSAHSLTLTNTSTGGQLRATRVCDTGTRLLRSPLPAVVGAGGSTSLPSLSSTGCVRTLAVITNQQQSPLNPSSSPTRSFTLTTGAPGPNQPPVANNDTYAATAGTPLTIPAPGVLANDTDPNGNPSTATSPTGQTGGTVSLNANGSFTFTPSPGFTGTGGFSYTANDGNGGTDSATVTINVTAAARSGYWMLSSAGTIYSFGSAANLGSAGQLPGQSAKNIAVTPSGNGYAVVSNTGRLSTFGDAPHLGDSPALFAGEEVTSISVHPSGAGYWLFSSRGRVFAYGTAPHHGGLGHIQLAGPVLGSVSTPSGNGYYMVASDGGIFAFGDAVFRGSMGGFRLHAPVTGLAPDPDGVGYWLVATDGGVFAFDSPFRGSMGGIRLDKPVVGMVAYGNGYLMVAADGGIFNFSTKPFAGSLGGQSIPHPIVAVAPLDK